MVKKSKIQKNAVLPTNYTEIPSLTTHKYRNEIIRWQRLMYSTRVCSLVNLRGGWVGRGGHPPPTPCLPPRPPTPCLPPHPPTYPPHPLPTPPPPTPPPCLPPHLPPPPTHNLHHHQLTHLNKEKTKTKRNWQKLPPMNSRECLVFWFAKTSKKLKFPEKAR